MDIKIGECIIILFLFYFPHLYVSRFLQVYVTPSCFSLLRGCIIENKKNLIILTMCLQARALFSSLKCQTRKWERISTIKWSPSTRVKRRKRRSKPIVIIVIVLLLLFIIVLLFLGNAPLWNIISRKFAFACAFLSSFLRCKTIFHPCAYGSTIAAGS